ncbi:hypothetical protein GUJ93_ZPchr0013g33760 [Zizania palustris]|uniref:Uncharacterized protein n=1 Tax=Zizania palustris TaxID=103762 RepID=A0A8J5WZ01_ZIZPA|nr:hypothetical protein GUJ93_ZPchr0013g33760 [Zizania palustris]
MHLTAPSATDYVRSWGSRPDRRPLRPNTGPEPCPGAAKEDGSVYALPCHRARRRWISSGSSCQRLVYAALRSLPSLSFPVRFSPLSAGRIPDKTSDFVDALNGIVS